MATQTSTRLTPPVTDNRDHIRGPQTAPVTLTEYGDYQCPYCGQAHAILQALMGTVGDQVRLVFRNFPLQTVHPDAELAAEAAEAAGAQGLFWEMHDMLYENQSRLSEPDLFSYAASLGLDMDRFAADLAAHRFEPRVREDFASGVRSGVNGTPTFFINGLRHDGPWDLESLIIAIETAGAYGPVRRGNTRGTGHR
jgi:protein-disulfide isomerase